MESFIYFCISLTFIFFCICIVAGIGVVAYYIMETLRKRQQKLYDYNLKCYRERYKRDIEHLQNEFEEELEKLNNKEG